MDNQRLRTARILIVDDQPSNITLLEHILRVDGYSHLRSTVDPRLALNIVREWEPDLIVLDLNMPLVDGFEVMSGVRDLNDAQLFLPVLVVSGDYSDDVRKKALASGARDFLTRPFDAIEIQLRIQNLLDARFLQRELFDHNLQLETRVQERTIELEAAQLELKEAQIEIIARLARAAELHDTDTSEHTQRVGLIAALIAQNLGLPEPQIELLRRAALLHDVGKIGIADPVLLKPGRLSPQERAHIQTHCAIGAQVLQGGHAELVQMAERIAISHHEHWDGHGYPEGLYGESIPLEARILAVADVFDALTHQRPYKEAWPVADAVQEINSQAGRQFDPQVVEAFMTLPHDELI